MMNFFRNLKNRSNATDKQDQEQPPRLYTEEPKRNESPPSRGKRAPMPPKRRDKRRVVLALYDYNARGDTEISFFKGDRMEVLDDFESDWWEVINLSTRRTGLIPSHFVADVDSINSEDWFFENVSVRESDKLLLAEENPRGTFLIRKSTIDPSGFTLIVKDYNDEKGYHVKRYKIKRNEKGYYIANNQVYPTVPALVTEYSFASKGLCQLLTFPCPKPPPQMWDLCAELRDKWEIDRNEIKLLKKIGQGYFGEVHYGLWRNSTKVAVKTLKEGSMSVEAFLQEAAIMKKFRHNRLVALYAVCSKEEPIYIVQEYMTKGSLLDFLRNGNGQFLSFEDLIYIAAQIASGMKYLETGQLIHGDLAARNVLVGENNIVKICDFGLTRLIEKDLEKDEDCPQENSNFPVKWTAVEGVTYGRFSIKSDVWSFGILLYEIFTYGQVPYPGMNSKEVMRQITKGYRMPKPENHQLPDRIYELMLNCWDAVPEKRPTFDYLNHFFDDYPITAEDTHKEVQECIYSTLEL